MQHAAPIPEGILPPDADESAIETQITSGPPFESRRIDILNKEGDPNVKKTRQWIRARGKISPAGGHEAHLSALAYMSDSYFIGTISRIHNLWRFPTPGGEHDLHLKSNPKTAEAMRQAKIYEGFGDDLENTNNRPEIGMMVSLDHTIYFHEPRSLKADEWVFTEMESPWSGDGRGLVFQKMWSADGRLIATCIQEVCNPLLITATNPFSTVTNADDEPGCCEITSRCSSIRLQALIPAHP